MNTCGLKMFTPPSLPIASYTYCTYLLARQGCDLEILSKYRGLNCITIMSHLYPYIYNGYYLNIDQFVPCELQEPILYLINKFKNNKLHEIKHIVNNEIDTQMKDWCVDTCYYFAFRKERDIWKIIRFENILENVFKDDPLLKQQIDFVNDNVFRGRRQNESDVINVTTIKLRHITKRTISYEEEHYEKYHNDDTWDAMTNGEYDDYMGCDNFDWMR